MKTLSEFNIGERLEVILDPVSRMDLIKYSGASGDFNPIHTVDAEAAKAGLPGIIAHGMWTMGNLAKLFTPYYEEGFIEDYQIRFSGMVFIDDVITLRASAEREENDSIYFAVHAINQKGQPVLKGKVKFSKYA